MFKLLRQSCWLWGCLGLMLMMGFHSQAGAALTEVAGCTFEPDGGGDRADSRGIRFTLSEDFQTLEVIMSANNPGVYIFTAEIRKSFGFTVSPLCSARVSVELPGNFAPVLVHMDFSSVSVGTDETFTLKFKDFYGPGSVYFEVINNDEYCPDVEETESNNGSNPPVRANDPWLRILGQGQPSILTLSSTYVATPPDMDGMIGFGEWPLASKLEFENGFITVVNDLHRMYVLVDVLQDGIEEDDDFFWLTFDVNGDGEITPDTDLQFATNPSTGEMRYQIYKGPGTWTGLQPETYSSMGKGFGCFFSDGTLNFSLDPFQVNCEVHRVWELGIDLDEIGARAGGMARVGLRVGSNDPYFRESIPDHFDNDFSNLIEVDLASSGLFFIFPDPTQNLNLDQGLNREPLEVSQAIQDRANSLPLVQGKKSVARVYSQSSISKQPGIISLYGSRNGVDLPGSPLAVFHNSPASIDREDIGDTANFNLPKTWTQGDVTFRAVVRDLFSRPFASADIPLAFRQTRDFNIWTIPLNTGTTAAPVLPGDDDVEDQEAFLEANYPVSPVHFERKPWEAIGPTSISNAIADLNDFFSALFLAWIFSGFSFDLPDQVYGVTSSGGGLSDPTWDGGLGIVARGGVSTHGIMAHEIIHNLGPGDCAVYPGSDLWGRHVSNRTSSMTNGYCIPGDATTYGCGATGADAGWQARYDDAEIHEVGVDTSVSPFRLVAADKPEVMSYCDDTVLPTSWISDYRWERMFNHFQTASLSAMGAESKESLREKIQPTIYLSGKVFRKGGGELDPAMVQDGIPMTQEEIMPGDYAVELWPEIGKEPLYVLSFNAYFDVDIARDIPDPREYDTFNLRLPVLQGVAQIRLTQKEVSVPLSIIDIDYSAPTVNVLSPAKGELWEGREAVKWSASDKEGDRLSFSLQYSPDKGMTWKPLSGRLAAVSRQDELYSFEVDTATIPAGPSRVDPTSLVRVIATDGYNTTSDDSELFFVAPNPPRADIAAPLDGSRHILGEMIAFKGSAQDEEDGVIPEEQMFWSYDGTPFGSGSEVQAALPAGTHEITLTAVDSDDQQGSDTITITIAPACEGNLDGDKDVDDADLAIFAADFGRTDCCQAQAPPCEGDFGGNCDVDGSNLATFAADFGRSDCP